MVVSIITSSFLVYIWWGFINHNTAYTCNKYVCHLEEAFRVLKNVKLDDKYENKLK